MAGRTENLLFALILIMSVASTFAQESKYNFRPENALLYQKLPFYPGCFCKVGQRLLGIFTCVAGLSNVYFGISPKNERLINVIHN